MTQQELQELKEHVNLQLKHLLCDNCRVEVCGKYQEIVCEQKYNQYKRYLECIEAYEQLQKYKKMEEDEQLIIRPCKPGCIIFTIVPENDGCDADEYTDCPVNHCSDCPYDRSHWVVKPIKYNPYVHYNFEFGTKYFTSIQEANEKIAELNIERGKTN